MKKNSIAQKIHPFFCLQQEHFCTCGFNILIVFAKCQEGVQRCTRCTACIMKFKKNSSYKGQNTKYALNYCGIKEQKDSWQSVLGNRNYHKVSSGFAFSPAVLFLPLTSAFISCTRKPLEFFARVNQRIRKGLRRVHSLCRDQQGLLCMQSYSDFLGKKGNTSAHHPLYPVLTLQGSGTFYKWKHWGKKTNSCYLKKVATQ